MPRGARTRSAPRAFRATGAARYFFDAVNAFAISSIQGRLW
jgi:hypothetical protein